ncbi:intraflagellar transport protein 22 homolog isoform X3 [Chiloscyllium plagiosum]|uniref:intraflagellar transport protein 22 homolog isoform X3 n=1 Tax=Chiloscyllium plagiosum TaxID=36176 RepID=UPI001CB7FD32|nr:intraflagellar transport protein 22 homolog isoform X3 [Chiloscyllium plagiosum]
MFNIKLLLLGPRESGKTVLANFLSDATEAIGGDYSPTQGVRILEYECPNVIANGKNIGCEVELWDCSGDQNHLKEIEMFYSSFVQQPRLHDSQCLLVAHHKPNSAAGKGRPNLAQHLNKLTLIHSNLEDDPEQVRTAFRQFLGAVVSSLSESRDKEEMSIIT